MENDKELKVANIRLVKEPSLYSEREIRTPQDAAEIMADELSSYDREVFCILNLKSNGQVINMNVVSMGTLNSSMVSPREVFKSSILSNAAGIIALHNHPSGDLTPSQDDIKTTERLSECGYLMNINLIDHIIVGSNGRTLSMRGEGYMTGISRSNHKEKD